MTFDEVLKIITYENPNEQISNREICASFDEETQNLICDMLEKMDACDFIELAPEDKFDENGNKKNKFDFSDLPIPYSKLKNNDKTIRFSPAVNLTFKNLLKEINTEGTNIEKPFLLSCSEDNGVFDAIGQAGEGTSQKCTYDGEKILNFMKNSIDGDNVAILHTHPAPLGKQHNTLFNKYQKDLEPFGIKPNGLNISLADVKVLLFFEKQLQKMNKNLNFSSMILMHDGNLITFSNNNGISIEDIKTMEIEQEENKDKEDYETEETQV